MNEIERRARELKEEMLRKQREAVLVPSRNGKDPDRISQLALQQQEQIKRLMIENEDLRADVARLSRVVEKRGQIIAAFTNGASGQSQTVEASGVISTENSAISASEPFQKSANSADISKGLLGLNAISPSERDKMQAVLEEVNAGRGLPSLG